MDFWSGVSIGSTLISLGGAFESWNYYKRSIDVTIYANTKIALVECEKIITYLNNMLKLSNSEIRSRGVKTLLEQACNYGEEINKSINEIRKIMPVKDFKDIEKLLNSQEIEVEKYISTFIQGTIVVDERLIIDDNFHACMRKIHEIYTLIKEKLEDRRKKIK